MRVDIDPSQGLVGQVQVPGDKSISHRAIMLGSIAKGPSRIKNYLRGQDCIDTAKAFESMGVKIRTDKDELIVYGRGLRGLVPPKGTIYAGNSGTTARLIAGILAGQAFETRLDGDSSLRKRPMGRIVGPLLQMGANIRASQGDLLPLSIGPSESGTLRGIEYRMPIASAQVKSAILLAGLYASDITRIHQSKVSRDHTEIMLRQLGCSIKTSGNTISLEPPDQLYGQDIRIPGDISSAAYLITAALLTPKSDLLVKDVGINPTRSGILDVYRQMGANISIYPKSNGQGEPIADILVKSSSLMATTIEGDLIPRLIDEIPIIALAASQAKGTTVIRDAKELKVKESNRIDTVVNMLKALGADIKATDDGMIIRGPKPLKGAAIQSSMDHRIALTCAVAGLLAEGQTSILDGQWVDISYPGFFETLERLRLK
ncbi:MAG: 3-phosphoshikimate 1-carboxyvinyltransferase [Clostridiales bacterium]|jgi:3-phosphoshikimate 1-carboxyvinyltransferase|nr:3-phosphoshikimate 1-carboxyvinyltransferase [Bacillota bacterium]NLH58115.1 3-phosphoshikimate 1-carboxyvinyltransferase [Clostridiales bacterium]